MTSEKCLEIITSELGLKGKNAEKFYDSFWKFIEDELLKEGAVNINGMGSFSLEKIETEGKDDFSIKFIPSSKFKSEIGIED